MKKNGLILFILLFQLFALFGYDIEQFQITFTDEERENRQIPTEIFYPVENREKPEKNESFPFIVFGHGWLMNYSYYENIVNEFVPQGWIMAFPRTEEGMFPEQEEFALDLAFLGEEIFLQAQNPESILYELADSLSVVMGHSMGGGCSVVAASYPAQTFASVVTFAAAETNPSAINSALSVSIPSLTFSASEDNITPPASNQMPIYENLNSNYKSYVSILGESHLGITNNDISYSILAAWLQFVKTNESVSNFEETLQLYETQISYLIDNNLSNVNQPLIPIVDFFLKNYPNPFNPDTNIQYNLDQKDKVCLQIFNAKGQVIRNLEDAILPDGNYQYEWNGEDEKGNVVSSGVYIIQLQVGQKQQSKACVLLK